MEDDDELTFDQLYADLVAAASGHEPPAESFSVAQFAADTGMTHKQALDTLMALRAAGRLAGDKFTVEGSRQWRFWFA